MYSIDNSQKSVRDFFCPEIAEGALSYRNPIAYDVQDRCRSAGIATIAQLVIHTEGELRSKSFSTQHLDFIDEKLKSQGLQLKTDGNKTFNARASQDTLAAAQVQWPKVPVKPVTVHSSPKDQMTHDALPAVGVTWPNRNPV